MFSAAYAEGIEAGAAAMYNYLREHPTASSEVIREVVRDSAGRIAEVIERQVPVRRKVTR